MQIHEIIQKLEEELDIKKGLFSKKIDIDNCIELLEYLKESVEQRVGEANRVLENRVSILKNADCAAKNTIKEAEKHAESTMTTNELIFRAEREADRVIESAVHQSEGIIKKTKEHLDLMFKDVEEFLLSNLAMIRKNREELRGINFVYTSK